MVSVIIPTFNRADTIERSIRSVLNQTITDLELIVVDDCSIDHTREIISKLEDPRIRYICLDHNQGPCVARNVGIDESQGDYIAFQDSDDSWYPDKLEKQLQHMVDYDADICVCQINRHGYGRENGIYPEYKQEIISYEQMISGFFASTPTILAKRDVCLSDHFDPEVRKMEDFDWMVRAARGRTVCAVLEPLVDVYLSSDSLTLSGYEKNVKMYQYFLKKYADHFHEYPQFGIFIKRGLAYNLTMLGGGQDIEIYREIYENTRNMADGLKYFLARIHLLQTVHKIVDHE